MEPRAFFFFGNRQGIGSGAEGGAAHSSHRVVGLQRQQRLRQPPIPVCAAPGGGVPCVVRLEQQPQLVVFPDPSCRSCPFPSLTEREKGAAWPGLVQCWFGVCRVYDYLSSPPGALGATVQDARAISGLSRTQRPPPRWLCAAESTLP